jgi:Flp pilus assembly pilin Flp
VIRVIRLVARWQVFVSGASNALGRQDGQTMAEYGIVLAAITIVVVLALMTFGTAVSDQISGIASILPGG